MTSIWPTDSNYLTQEETRALEIQLLPRFKNRLTELNIDQSLSAYLPSFYIPFAAKLRDNKSSQHATLIVGINGAQGSGKSTLSRLLADVLQHGFNLNTVILSIDDLYKTRKQRQKIAVELHPLFKTRGVPGTHDTRLGIEVIEKIKNLKENEILAYPVFDKGNDDRAPANKWPHCKGAVDILIFEGWCVGAHAQTEQALLTDTNQLEATEDSQHVWRGIVNKQLETEYKKLFSLLDYLVFIQIPSFHCVMKWRGLQEQKLVSKQPHEKHLMATTAALKRFIDHYERLTLFQLADLPSKADMVITLGVDHQIKQTRLSS